VLGVFQFQSLVVAKTFPAEEGDLLGVRLYSVARQDSSGACAFEANVLCVQDRPCDYMHLSWPKNVATSFVRERARIDAEIPALLRIHGQSKQCLITDISLTGFRFSIDPSILIAIGSVVGQIDFDVTIGGKKEPLSLKCSIINQYGLDERGKRMYAATFQNITSRERSTLMGLIGRGLVESDMAGFSLR
jgi:hypothetical protein